MDGVYAASPPGAGAVKESRLRRGVAKSDAKNEQEHVKIEVT
jgi:hypothetical protein